MHITFMLTLVFGIYIWPFDNIATFNLLCVKLKQLRFTVLLFGQVIKVFGLLYSVIFQIQIRSSFFGHLN